MESNPVNFTADAVARGARGLFQVLGALEEGYQVVRPEGI